MKMKEGAIMFDNKPGVVRSTLESDKPATPFQGAGGFLTPPEGVSAEDRFEQLLDSGFTRGEAHIRLQQEGLRMKRENLRKKLLEKGMSPGDADIILHQEGLGGRSPF